MSHMHKEAICWQMNLFGDDSRPNSVYHFLSKLSIVWLNLGLTDKCQYAYISGNGDCHMSYIYKFTSPGPLVMVMEVYSIQKAL